MKRDFYLYIDGKPVMVSEEVYREYYRGERKERYFMEDLKRGRVAVDKKTQERTFLPGREDSYERLLEKDVPFVAPGELVEDEIVRSVLLEQVLNKLSAEEKALIWELYYLDKTERQVCDVLHIAKTTLRDRRDRILVKLKKLLEEN